MLNRRAFLQNLMATSVGIVCPQDVRADERVSLSLRRAKIAPITVPRNFTGLGYEMSSVATPGLLRVENRRYVELIRGLGNEGVLRVGGIVANYSHYEPSGTPAFDRHNTVITRSVLAQFGEFLSTIGWSVIWSVNFAQGTLEQAVEEARAVSAILGRRLLALEIGNEVDTYGKGQPFRSPSYDYADYRKQYEQWHAAITRAVPGIHFAAPDTAQSVEWVERMARDARRGVQLLTTHYYRNGQTRGSAEQLATPDPRLTNLAERLHIASQQSGIPWRMCEMNSFSGGGLPGVSDTFLGALWTLNVMLYLAQSGCAGVNIETGVNQLGFVSSYSPIQDNGKGVNSAGVPYYGMLAFATAFAGCNQMFPLETLSEDPSLAAYLLGAAGRPRSLVVVNTNPGKTAYISIAGLGISRASLLRLSAASASSTTGVTFAGAAVGASGHWQPATKEQVRSERISVPAMSAAILIASI
jgi:hypothetical protein